MILRATIGIANEEVDRNCVHFIEMAARYNIVRNIAVTAQKYMTFW